ncbi:hypothetical protein [Sphingomonas bacterium]|uniref:hypothetical protein n=1 Tax=Sphingomonas bacterium TaxID=1895847 RepID=UPI0015773F57|nr:hypothetical protein [Sphingomonas bacterium]
MRQVRSEARKQARIKRHEKAVELQMALEDRAAARSVQRELAELHRGSIRWAARFKVRAEPKRPETRTSPVTKRVIGTAMKASARATDSPRPASSWVIDALGMKGVIWQQSYLGRKSPGQHRGAARENWEYIVRDEAVLLDATGEPVIISNMGDDWVEIGAAWQAMEDASTRANAKIQLLAIAPFDSDMSEAEMIAALKHFCTTVLDPLDLPYSAAIHAPPAQGDQRNFHPHIAFSLRPMRRVEPYAWEVADEVCGELDGRDGVQMLRHLWAHSMSAAAEEARSNRRYTGLGYGARRLDLEAGEHLGEARAAIVARGGHVRAHERNRIKAARNAARRVIRDADNKIAALTKVRDAAVKRIERHGDAVVPAKIIRAAPPVEVATLLTRARAPASTIVLRAPASAISARANVQTRAYAPSRPTLAAAVAPVEPTVITTSPAATPATIRTPAVTPLRPATRLSVTLPVVAGDRLETRFVAKPAVTYEPAGRVHPAALPLVPTVAPIGGRTLSGARPVRPRVSLAPIVSTTTLQRDDPVAPLFDALAIARLARIRKRRKGTGTDDPRLDTLPTLGAVDMLDAVPSLDQIAAEATSRWRVDAERLGDADLVRVARLTALDPYVADYGGDDGQVETDYPALKAIGVGWDWLQAPGVQQALRAMRDEQQRVVADLAREATARPLAFAKTGARFWPRDLPADLLRRIDRWANDPGFERDAFEMQRTIDRAHAARDAEHRKARVGNEQVGAKALPRIPDGFGGWRQGPAPVFHDHGIRARIAAFDTATGKPTEQLLMLLMLAGQHPRRIDIAADGRLMALPGKPAMLAALLHPWRHDDRVAALVTETVRASREAGNPVWPRLLAGAVQAYAARAAGPSGLATRRPPPDLSRGPAR